MKHFKSQRQSRRVYNAIIEMHFFVLEKWAKYRKTQNSGAKVTVVKSAKNDKGNKRTGKSNRPQKKFHSWFYFGYCTTEKSMQIFNQEIWLNWNFPKMFGWPSEPNASTGRNVSACGCVYNEFCRISDIIIKITATNNALSGECSW